MIPPLPRHSALSHFRHALYIACWVSSASDLLSLLSCLGLLHPCSTNSDTAAAALLPTGGCFAPSCNSCPVSHGWGWEHHQYLTRFSLLWAPSQPQDCTSHLSLKIISLPRGRDRRQKNSKGNRISPEQFCLQLWE